MKIRHIAQKFFPAFILFLSPCLPSQAIEAKTAEKAKNTAKAEQAQKTRNIVLSKPKVSKSPKKEVHVIMNDPLMKKKWDLKKTNV